jgi:hypothetical protein
VNVQLDSDKMAACSQHLHAMSEHAAHQLGQHPCTVAFTSAPVFAVALQNVTCVLLNAAGNEQQRASTSLWVVETIVSGGGKSALCQWAKAAITYNEAVRVSLHTLSG